MWGALVQQLVRWRGVCPGGLLRYWAGADVEEGDMGYIGDRVTGVEYRDAFASNNLKSWEFSQVLCQLHGLLAHTISKYRAANTTNTISKYYKYHPKDQAPRR